MPCPVRRSRDLASDLDAMPPLHVVSDAGSLPAAERIPETAGAAELRPANADRPRRNRARRWTTLAAFAALGLVIYTLRDDLPSASSVSTALTHANPRWMLVAAGLEAVSMAMFAWQQRSLLRAMSVRMSRVRALGLTYARSAIAISMPAGTAVSAAFAFQQYRRSGANRDTAAAVMILSGLVSFLGIAGLYVLGVTGVVIASPADAWHDHAALIVAVAAAVGLTAVGWLAIRLRPARPMRPTHAKVEVHQAQRGVRQWTATTVATARRNIATWRTVPPRHWAAALTFAGLNWLTDLLCLAAAARAFSLPIGLFTLSSIYLGVQFVRQIPATPGGIGLIETGLLAGLATAGVSGAAAAAVVLTYRLFSCWLIIPIGGLSWLGLRPRSGRVSELTAGASGATSSLAPRPSAALVGAAPANDLAEHMASGMTRENQQ